MLPIRKQNFCTFTPHKICFRMHRFFADYAPDAARILLNDEESRHCLGVLRHCQGDTIEVVNGAGLLAKGSLFIPKKGVAAVLVDTIETIQPLRNYSLHLAVAPTKNADRIEWLLEKAIEVGLDAITFISCNNSERVKINFERMKRVAIAALKQSSQPFLPKINPICAADAFMKQHQTDNATKLIAHCRNGDKKSLFEKKSDKYVVMIGPEGDFTESEINTAAACGFIPLQLGHMRLRTETAALVVAAGLSQVQQ